MPSERILICGAGVAGSILAYWLAKHDFQVVVIERSKSDQKAGQGLEIEEPALQVVKAMGIFHELHEKRTGELGFQLVDDQARSCGILEVGGLSLTGALEIMRGDLTEVLYHAANQSANVTYKFETTIHGLSEMPDKVVAELQHRKDRTTTIEEFDVVVGADGVRSHVRQLAMGSPEQLQCRRSIGAFVAYFSIPRENHDWPYSRACQFPGRRLMWMRPTGKESTTTSVYLIHLHNDLPSLRQANAAGNRRQQKEAFAELFGGLGWETRRAMEQMMEAENFYSDELVQIKLPKWSRDRVVLLGDAAWAPTPFTGQGNQLAILGAWVLAQELSRHRSPLAFDRYEKRLRSYVEHAQSIPLGGYAPYICVPQTSWGIWLFQTLFRLVAWAIRFTSGTKLATMMPEETHPDLDLQMDTAGAKEGR